MKAQFYIWLLPLIWTSCSLCSFHFPGDEYGMYAISSLAGAWICLFFNSGDIHDLFFRVSIAVTGGIIMVGIGFLMDRLRIRKIAWSIIFLVAAAIIFVLSVKAYPTIDRALSKNGSWWAYVFFSINMGLYCAIILSLVGKGLESAWRKITGINQPGTLR